MGPQRWKRVVTGSFCIYQPVPSQGRQVEAAEAVSSHGNVCLLTTVVYSQRGRLRLSQEEHVPLPVTVCPVLLAMLNSSPCYHAVLPAVRHALRHFDRMPSTCVCGKHLQAGRGISSHHGCPQSFYIVRLLNKLLPFCPGA